MEAVEERYVNEDRAAFLLGLSAVQLRLLSAETGIGKTQKDKGVEQRVFTYSELYRLCKLAARFAG